tara:strand:- start:528 stop:770 length:243 start_codon:yes stop_codon:yes gene_type:complete
MSNKLLEVLKRNQEDIKFIKSKLESLQNEIDNIKAITDTNSNELNTISNKSYYIEKYLENIQNEEIEMLLTDEKIHVSDS